MAKKYAKRNGLLPSAETQIALGIIQADIAHRVARSQSQRGVDPSVAAQHAFNVAVAVPLYFMLILPVMGMSLLVGSTNPVFVVWRAAQFGLGLIIGVRMSRWAKEPATNRLNYSVPTWALVTLGGVSVAVFFCFVFYRNYLV